MARDSKSATVVTTSAPGFQSCVDVELDGIPRWGEPKQNSRQQGNGEREYDDYPVNSDARQPRYVAWIDGADYLQASLSDREPRKTSKYRQEYPFREQLTDPSPPACAQSGAHRHFLLP